MKRQIAYITLVSIGILIISSHYTYAQPRMEFRYLNYGKFAHRSFGLEGSLELLNLWQEQPQYIQDIYKSAFQILSSDPKASFTDVAFPRLKIGERLNFLRLCKENGITHSGGPMLGNISANGANVWIRTLQPASVEVRINVDGTVKTFGPVLSSENSDMTAIVEVTGLNAETSYPYNVFIDDNPINIDAQPYITTTPQDNLPSKARIAFGTCYHRWGLWNQNLSDQISSREPLAFYLGVT